MPAIAAALSVLKLVLVISLLGIIDVLSCQRLGICRHSEAPMKNDAKTPSAHSPAMRERDTDREHQASAFSTNSAVSLDRPAAAAIFSSAARMSELRFGSKRL